MPKKRLLLIALLALGLAPGTFMRNEAPPADLTSPVVLSALEIPAVRAGPLVLERAWQISSDHALFGGYSALVPWGDDGFLAASDTGNILRFGRPDDVPFAPHLQSFRTGDGRYRVIADVESLVVAPDGRTLWAGVEHWNQIIAFNLRFRRREAIQPEKMAGWGDNSGAESMVRLGDGRFVLIAEGSAGDELHEGLVYPADPMTGAAPQQFFFKGIDGYSPTDAALLPDGTVAVLMRGVEWGWPVEFRAAIVRFDPAEIAAGATVSGTLVARIDPPIPLDNFEGFTVVEEEDDSWSAWIVSDDNRVRYQRTLLLKFRWDQETARTRQKARR